MWIENGNCLFLSTVVNVEVLNTSVIYGDYVEILVTDNVIVELPLSARYSRGT